MSERNWHVAQSCVRALTSIASSMASPIISLVISIRSFCFSNSRMMFWMEGRFMRLFIIFIACNPHSQMGDYTSHRLHKSTVVAPRMASAMACVDFRVCMPNTLLLLLLTGALSRPLGLCNANLYAQ
jgi:hypothetical protein